MNGNGVPRATVLAVDDKPANHLALAAVLEDAHDLIFAASGGEAIDIVRSKHVDVILMDIQMPEMDGFEAAQKIKSMEEGKDIPIIFVTAVYREDPFVRRGYESGGIDYFAKPFDPEILKLKVGIYSTFRLRGRLLEEREAHVREAEELLRVGRKLSAVLESLPVGVMIADIEGRICQITGEVSRILGVTEHENSDAYGDILGWWDSAGRVLKNYDGPLARAVHLGENAHSEPTVVRSLGGQSKTIVVSASPLHGLDGGRVGAVVLIQDLTETKRIEAALEERVTRFVSLGVQLEESAAR